MIRSISILIGISLIASFIVFAAEETVTADKPAAAPVIAPSVAPVNSPVAPLTTAAPPAILPPGAPAIAAACVACHGSDGNSPTPMWPKIAGLSRSYILKQLQEYQKGPQGDRNEPTMYGIVQGLTPQDLADLAEFYSTQQMTIGVVPQAQLALGQKLYRGGDLLSGVPACAACHDPSGMGNSLANFPRLSGQNSQYVIDQLNKFKSGARKNIMMNDIAAKLTDAEIQAVASYVEGLH